jgi:hypothetical protein
MAVTEGAEIPETAAPAEQPTPVNDAAAQVPSAEPQPAASEPAPEKSLEELLSEFDQQTKPGPLGQPAEPQPATEQSEQPEQQIDPWLFSDERIVQAQTQLNAAKEAYEKEIVRQRDLADFDTWEKHLDSELREAFPSVPDGLVKMFLEHAIYTNDRVRLIADNRYNNPALFQAMIKDMGRHLYREMTLRPDRDLTETKALVSHAVRGASTSVMPEEPAPRFDKMSDRELRAWQEENLGSSQI